MRNYAKFYLTEKGEKFIRTGHVWCFAEEITKVEGEYRNGDIVDVLSHKGKYMGSGFVNDHSKIRVRIISTNTNDKFDGQFWSRRARYALDYRRTVMGEDFDCCRLIFGEADGLPGLTVDRFHDVLVAQVLSLGTEQRKESPVCTPTASMFSMKQMAIIWFLESRTTSTSNSSQPRMLSSMRHW